MSLVSLRAAILGFLDLEPTTGYALRERFEGSVGSFWSVTQSQIYRELHALEAGGLVVKRVEPGDGRPDRKVYSLSAEGRRALRAWLEEPLEPMQLRHPLLLKLVFSAGAPPGALDRVLERYEAGLVETRAEYEARRHKKEIFSLARSPREADLWLLSIEHGLAFCDYEIAWVRGARRRLAAPCGAGGPARRAKRRAKGEP